MRRSVFGWLVLMTGCASSGGGSRPEARLNAEPILGSYDYVANLPGQQVRGSIRVLSDTILVEPTADYCRPITGMADPLAVHYTCTGPGRFEQIRLKIDRRNPTQLSKWSATYRVQRQREVCRQYAVQNGRQVCVQTGTEMYETTESFSGALQVWKATS